MPLTKLTDPAKTINSPTVYETINNIIAFCKTMYDVFTSKHTTGGAHDDPLLQKGRGKVSFAGGAPTLDYNEGIVSSISDQATGHTRVTLSTAATSTDGIHVSVTILGTSFNITAQVNIVDTTHVDIYTRDAVSETLNDYDFSFAVSID